MTTLVTRADPLAGLVASSDENLTQHQADTQLLPQYRVAGSRHLPGAPFLLAFRQEFRHFPPFIDNSSPNAQGSR
jgi:hypothetical protein